MENDLSEKVETRHNVEGSSFQFVTEENHKIFQEICLQTETQTSNLQKEEKH
jgi:hypothetical protein